MEWGLKTCGMGTITGSLVKRGVIPSMDQFVYPPCPTAALPKGIQPFQQPWRGYREGDGKGKVTGICTLLWSHLYQVGHQNDQNTSLNFPGLSDGSGT